MTDKDVGWHSMIVAEMDTHGETFDDLVSVVVAGCETGEQALLSLHTPFYAGFGGSSGAHFTLWTSGRVYFPVVYDGAEWVGSVSRTPDGLPTEHFGCE